ncbi:hypothetical protein [Aerosakkonema funiforme]|uniref:hypothetical protein n=1 Tax=Aerosakkonema funiforme TaxID=1246630 RepID=UPI0035B70706
MKKLFQTFTKAIALCAIVIALSFSVLAPTASAQSFGYGFYPYQSGYGGGFYPFYFSQGYGFYPYQGFYGAMNPNGNDAMKAEEDTDSAKDSAKDSAEAEEDRGCDYGHFFGAMNKGGAMNGYGGGANQYQGYYPFWGGMRKWAGAGEATTNDTNEFGANSTTKPVPADPDAIPAS